jgi:hypothetical protein
VTAIVGCHGRGMPAFGGASKHVPADFGEVMVFLASDVTKKLSARDLGAEVQRSLRVSDPLVLDSVLTFAHDQLGTACQLNDRVVRCPEGPTDRYLGKQGR